MNTIDLARPGISTAWLARAGVRTVNADEARELVGFAAPGLLIPYHCADGSRLVVNGKPFARLRVADPGDGPRYLSPGKSGCQAYIPPGLPDLLREGCDLVVVEGEFKALSLVESAVAAVGIGGISSATPRGADGNPELLPGIRRLIETHRPARLLFLGDSDTAMIEGFPREAVKLAKVSGLPVALPRIAADAPGKGADDLREVLGADGFYLLWRQLVAAAEIVTAGTDPAALALRLLRREAEALGRLTGDARDDAEARLVKLAARTKDVALGAEVEDVFERMKIPRRVTRARVKAYRDAEHEKHEARLVEEVTQRTAPDGDAPLYFDGAVYFRRERDGCFGRLLRPDALLHFHALGLRRTGDPISPAESALFRVQTSNRVNFAGPLCGRGAGLIEENGSRILVTRPPYFIPGNAGQSPTIDALLASLFGVCAEDATAPTQVALFIGWLKHAREAMRHPDRHLPGVVLGLVGAPNCGKTLLQSAIITPALGGRCADPTAYLTGATPFNADLWSAEHLMLGDKALDGDGAKRDRLKTKIKEIVANDHHHLHAKGRDGITLRPVWRVTIAANDDPESATVLPTLDAGFADKIIYLRASSPAAPFFNEQTPGAREDFARRLREELPAFLHAVDQSPVPPELVCGRFGVKAWHHPEIVRLLESGDGLQPVAEVLARWIDNWQGTDEREIETGDLFDALDDLVDGQLARRKIASGVSHLGHQLARLARTPDWRGRLEKVEFRVGGRLNNRLRRGWHIKGAAQ